MNPISTPSALMGALSAGAAANVNAVKSDARADGANGGGAPAESSTQAEFHQRVGQHNRMPRVSRGPRAPSPAPTKKRNQAGANKPVHDDHPIDHATVEALSRMSEGGGAGLEEFLNDFDTLARHSLLRQAIARNEGEVDDEQLGLLRDQLTKLERDDGPAIARAERQRQPVASLLEGLDAQARGDAGYDPASLGRFLDTFNGGRGGERSADAILRSFIEHVGLEHVVRALPDVLNAKSRAPATRERAVGPRLWVSMGQMAKLFQIQSCLAIANDLHTKLTVAGITPSASLVEGGRALLNVADARQSQPEQLAKQIVGKPPLAPRPRMKMYKAIREAVDSLPTTLWPRDKMALRAEQLKALRAECQHDTGGDNRLTAEQRRDSERREQRLREELPAQAPTPITSTQEQ
ncbi:MAG: hypothetical protein V4754_19000 [Pseudomonadota bacterium]